MAGFFTEFGSVKLPSPTGAGGGGGPGGEGAGWQVPAAGVVQGLAAAK